MKTSQRIFQVIKLLVAAGIVYWLVTSGKLNFRALQNLVSWRLGPPVLFLAFLGLLFGSERWRLLLKTQRINEGVWPTFKLSMIGTFFNFAMPGGVGGDVVKAYYFTKEHPGARVVAVTSVMMDRILGLYAMVIMAITVMFFDLNHIMRNSVLVSLFYAVMTLFFICSLALAIVFSKKIYTNNWLNSLLHSLPFSSKTMKLYESMHMYGNSGKAVLLAILTSLLSQVCAVLILSIAGYAAGIEVPLGTYFLVAPLGFMAMAIPISPAGIGVGQAAFYFLFNLYTGTESELGPTVITAYQVILLLFSLIGAFYYLRRKDRNAPIVTASDQ